MQSRVVRSLLSNYMNYPLMIAVGLLFLAANSLVTHSTGRTALVVLSCVAFLIAVILTFVGTAGVPGTSRHCILNRARIRGIDY